MEYTYLYCIRAYLPCEGTETCIASHSSFSIWILGIRTYLPREGTETHWLFSFWFNRFNCIRTYLPREGTETPHPQLLPFLTAPVKPPIHLSRGRKLNWFCRFSRFNRFCVEHPIHLARGDGNLYSFFYLLKTFVNQPIDLERGRKLHQNHI